MNKLRILFAIFCIGLVFSCPAQSKKAIKKLEKGKEAMRKGLLVEAVVHLTDAISFAPDFAEAYDMRGRSFNGMGRKDAAMKDYKKAAELDPKLVVPLVNLLGKYKEEENWKQVIHYAELIYKHIPYNACAAVFELGSSWDKLEDEQRAREYFEQLLSMDCEDMDESIEQAQKRLLELKK